MKRRRNKIELPSLFWRDVVGYEGLYQVSIDGEARSTHYHRGTKERILRPRKNNNGYLYVNLWKNGKYKSHLVHRLVAQAFIPNPYNLPCVNHKDENPLNNKVENLEWCTQKYNITYGTAMQRMAEKHSKAVVALDPESGEIIHEFPSTIEAERNGGYNNANISACCLGKQKRAYGYIWKYKEDIPSNKEEYTEWFKSIKKNHSITSPCKPVVALDTQGRIVHVFPSIAEAERNGGYHHSAIVYCCRGRKGFKTYKGLIWHYQDDYLKKIC